MKDMDIEDTRQPADDPEFDVVCKVCESSVSWEDAIWTSHNHPDAWICKQCSSIMLRNSLKQCCLCERKDTDTVYYKCRDEIIPVCWSCEIELEE